MLRWFMEALQPLTGIRYRESQGVGVVLGEPRAENPREPGVLADIVIPACRVTAIPIPSDFAPEYVIAGWEEVRAPSVPAMRFRLAVLGGRTYVMASCDPRLPAAQEDFLRFLKQVQARYPTAGPFWQAYETERKDRLKEALQLTLGDAIPAERCRHFAGRASRGKVPGTSEVPGT